MKISFRLAELLQQHHDLGRGTIKRICDHTPLERHKVAALLNNQAKYVSLETMAALCDYLIERHHVDQAQLPGLLFRIEPEEFSALVANRKYLEICIGMRTESKADAEALQKKSKNGRQGGLGQGPRRRWVMASDSYLHGIFLHELYGLGHQRLPTQPRFMEQRLVSAFGVELGLPDARLEGQKVYDHFKEMGGDRGLLCLGSVRSNVVVETLVAENFGAPPFVSQDRVTRPTQRSCPIFFRYRDDDFQPPSCHGGVELAESEKTSEPGIYFETPGGSWSRCLSNEQEDAALVFYVYRVPEARLEIVMGGFSGRATLCLALELRGLMGRLWPPSYDTAGLKVGAFIVRFEFANGKPRDPNAARRMYEPSRTEVIPLAEEVLKRRLEKKSTGK